jgi:hypothetical protein
MTEYTNKGMTVGDVEVSVTTEGPNDDAEKVHMHVMDEAAKAMQAVDQDTHPDECEGQMFTVEWEDDDASE